MNMTRYTEAMGLFEGSLGNAPTVANTSNGKKRAVASAGRGNGGNGGNGGGGGGDGGSVLNRSVRTLLTVTRKIESQVEYVFLIEATTPLAIKLKQAIDVHSAMKPEKGPHPLGAPRHLIYAALIEGSLDRIAGNAILKALYDKLDSGNAKSTPLLRAFLTEISDEETALTLDSLRQFVTYCSYRVTEDGKGLLRVSPAILRTTDDKLEKIGLFGIKPLEVFEMVSLACRDERCWGPGPAGSFERTLSRKGGGDAA